MKLKTILENFHTALDVSYGKEEVNTFFDLLMDHFLGLKRIALVLNPDYTITEEQNQRFSNALTDLKHHKPIQYIIGETEFYGLPFKVNEHTLIPRPETEELVEWIVDSYSGLNEDSFRILDLGTGSGCIAVSLAKNMSASQIFAADVSKETLKVASQNATQNGVEIEFIHDDILNPSYEKHNLLSHSYDIIVSNPPYVRESEKLGIKANVLEHEPHLALFVHDDDPLQFYKSICEFASNHLTDNGALYFEINEFLGKQMIQLLLDYGFNNVKLRQDHFGKDRMIRGLK